MDELGVRFLVSARRTEQRATWEKAKEDALTDLEWLVAIRRVLARAEEDWFDDNFDRLRQQLVEVTALAVAALESSALKDDDEAFRLIAEAWRDVRAEWVDTGIPLPQTWLEYVAQALHETHRPYALRFPLNSVERAGAICFGALLAWDGQHYDTPLAVWEPGEPNAPLQADGDTEPVVGVDKAVPGQDSTIRKIAAAYGYPSEVLDDSKVGAQFAASWQALTQGAASAQEAIQDFIKAAGGQPLLDLDGISTWVDESNPGQIRVTSKADVGCERDDTEALGLAKKLLAATALAELADHMVAGEEAHVTYSHNAITSIPDKPGITTVSATFVADWFPFVTTVPEGSGTIEAVSTIPTDPMVPAEALDTEPSKDIIYKLDDLRVDEEDDNRMIVVARGEALVRFPGSTSEVFVTGRLSSMLIAQIMETFASRMVFGRDYTMTTTIANSGQSMDGKEYVVAVRGYMSREGRI